MSQYQPDQTYDFEADEHQGRMFDVAERANFVTKTYSILFGAIVAFIALEVAMFKTGIAEQIFNKIPGLVLMGGFIVVGWLATHVAHRAKAVPIQMLALAGFVTMEAVIFAPLLVFATQYADPDGSKGILTNAVGITVLGFVALTTVAFVTRKDFSFLRSILMWGGICAVGLIVCAFIFGFTLGPVFWVAMVALAGASILYDTSNIIHHYPEDRAIAAALELFASVAMLFWYVLRLVIAFSSDD